MRPAGYEFAVGSYFQAGANRSAGEVGAHLDHLREHQGGELTPQAVVDDARNANSPLHSLFEWNDGAAAEQHRLHQARGLIRSVVAIYAEAAQEPTKVRAFVHIPEPGQAHYRSTPDAMSAEHTRSLVLQRAWREWQTFQAKYASLKEFSALFEAAERVQKKIPQPARARRGSRASAKANDHSAESGCLSRLARITAGRAWHGAVGSGGAGPVKAGMAGQGPVGEAWLGGAC